MVYLPPSGAIADLLPPAAMGRAHPEGSEWQKKLAKIALLLSSNLKIKPQRGLDIVVNLEGLSQYIYINYLFYFFYFF
jgi:hypothetical protein